MGCDRLGISDANRIVTALASMQFQKVLDQVLSGIPNTCCYIDDILVTGSNH